LTDSSGNWQICPLSVRDLVPTAAKVRRRHEGISQYFVEPSWVEVFGAGGEFPSNRSQARTAITRENYEFTYAGESVLDGQQCYLMELKPKRKEKDLIVGEAWVDKQSFLIRRIEGEIAKPPSWWLKQVRINLSFADLEGTWLQTTMKAVADVRIFGPHTLTSRIVDSRH
jgi:hypothetical protein